MVLLVVVKDSGMDWMVRLFFGRSDISARIITAVVEPIIRESGIVAARQKGQRQTTNRRVSEFGINQRGRFLYNEKTTRAGGAAVWPGTFLSQLRTAMADVPLILNG
jgi:hypothetical protein